MVAGVNMAQAKPEALLLLLREAEVWDPDTCRCQFPSAFPVLLSVYENPEMKHNWTEQICVLRILMEKFLPHINLSELEQAFLSKVLPKTVQLFDLLIHELSSQAKGLTTQNVDLRMILSSHLQALMQVLEALSQCVEHIHNMQETLSLEHVRSLPSPVFHVIKDMYLHCRDSESLYSGCQHFSDLYQSLFKKAYDLQKQLMGLFDMLSVASCATEDSTAIIISVIYTMLEICSAVSSFDHALHANTWKFIIRQSFKYKSLIKESLKHADLLSGLCEDILLSFQSCLEMAEQMQQSGTQESAQYKLFQKTVKLCRFFATSLVQYTKEFNPFLADSCNQLHQMYLQIYSKLCPSLFAPVISEAHRDEITKGFVALLDPLLLQLLPFKPFLEVALSKTLDLSPELQFPQCRFLLSVMDMLPSQTQDVQDLWHAGSQIQEEIPRVPLFTAFFLSLQQCSGELSLPICLPEATGKGQMEGPVSLYHYICSHLFTFITSLSGAHFLLLEQSLLETVLGSNSIIALLAMDAWCFLARYGPADLCAHHVFIIAHLVKVCPTESLLGVLLRRLLFLMTADHQLVFTQRFPPSKAENLVLWQHLSLQALLPPLRKQVALEILAAGLAQTQAWLASERPLKQLPQVNTALSALLSACQSAGEVLEVWQQTALVRGVGQFSTLQATQVSSEPCLQQTLCLILRFLVVFIQMVEPQLLAQILALQDFLLQLNPPDHVLIAVLDFLSSMGKHFIPPDFQTQILPKLSCLFAALLANSRWLIHHCALEAFAKFAEQTSHEDILLQCVRSEEIKSKVVCFLSKLHHAKTTGEGRIERVKEENASLKQHLLQARADKAGVLLLEPSPKRTCYSSSKRQYKSAIATAEGALEDVKLLLQKSPAPLWLAKKLQALQATLDRLKTNTSR